MASKTVCLLVFLLFLWVNCKNIKHRNPRFIGGTSTSYITSTQLVTSFVPSSCVSVDPTLPPCRSVRYLSFPNFGPWGRMNNPHNQTHSMETTTTALGWGEYFGIYAPTVTVTRIEMQTTILKDPRIVVTYAVKGCRPQKIPDDLDRCESPPTISIQDIMPTSTVAVLQSTRSITNLVGSKSFPENTIQDNTKPNGSKDIQRLIESSTENILNETVNVSTDPLPF